jgi:pyruvate dehydrogenase E2 component (dihydrolipoamide acetyltransferase)
VTYTDLILRALALTLPTHPFLNAAWADGQIRTYSEVHLGVAIASEQGLVVGIVHRAESMSLEEIARTRVGLGERARQNALSPEDVSNGTFTFTNLGMFGVDDFTPILNPPQSAILAAGAIVERPVGEDGQIVLRPTLRLTLAVDHRVADGVDGARFLQDLRILLEQADKLAD